MKAYSVALRQRIVAAVERGVPRAEVATTFGVSLSTIKRLLARRRRNPADDLAAPSPPGRHRTIAPEQHAARWAHLETNRDATLEHHTSLWNTEHGLSISPWTMGRAIRRLGWTRKTVGATERDEQARAAYRERIAGRRAADVVGVDECGTKSNLTPVYARAPRGHRAIGSVPRNTDKNTTLIAAMTPAGLGPALLLEGATDTAAFEGYVEHFLAPTLTPGNVVVLDNLSAHKSKRVRALIEGQGCELWYLPAYSPDLSPIEEAFSKLKTLLRRAAARTRQALHAAIAHVLDQSTALDAQRYFSHCGYGLQVQ